MDFSSYSLPELRRLQTRIESEIRRRSDTTRRSLLKQVQKMAAEQGMTLGDLLEGTVAPAETKAPASKVKRDANIKKKAKTPTVIKYPNPANPDQGWSGHGRRPQWVVDWLAQGKAIEGLAA